MAVRLREGVRAIDLVARYAGDEFVILIDDIDGAAAADAVRGHLESSLREPLAALRGLTQDAPAGAALGLAVYPEDGEDADALVRAADHDMYRRKTSR